MAASSPVMGHLSVQAIKGKFEQMHEDPSACTPFGPTRATPPCRKRRSPFSPVDPGPARNCPALIDPPEDPEPDDLPLTDPCPRPRSRSVGTSVAGHQRGWKNSLIKIPNPVKKMEGNSPFEKESSGVRIGSQDRLCFPTSDNFGSFSEKQKLVESIVLNIKNSAAQKKKEQELERRNKEFKVKHVILNTSKFEKNLKNVLERGARRKWNEKATRDNSQDLPRTLLEGNHDLDILQRKQNEILNQDGSRTGRHKSYSKINSILGVELYPLDSPERSHPVSSYCSEDKELHRKDTSGRFKPPSPRPHPVSGKDAFSHQEENLKIGVLTFPEERTIENSSPHFDLDQNPSKIATKPEPIRPPRRRRGKKGMAPQPPSWPVGGVLESPSPSPRRRRDEDRVFPITDTNDKMKERRNSEDCKLKEGNDSALFPPKRSSDTPNEHTYEVDSLNTPQVHSEKVRTTYIEKNESLLTDVVDDAGISEECRTLLDPCRKLSMSEPTLDVSPSLPHGSPPKKPPRTFAYDIYKALKNDDELEETSTDLSPTKLSPMEVESLYTKPIRRVKEEFSDRRSPTNGHLNPAPKPTIAPKPLDILTRAKQRLSVSEPLPSAADTKEFMDCKQPVKRNSSFRFSFRKQKKGSNSSPRPVILRLDNQVGKKFKVVTKSFHPRKSEDKRVRFQPANNSKKIYDEVNGGPIYAVPNSNDVRPPEKPKELHYMCSPLFQETSKSSRYFEDEDSAGTLKENCPPSPNRWEFRDRLRIMDGFKEDFRESCRMVQKRLKGAAVVNRHHHR